MEKIIEGSKLTLSSVVCHLPKKTSSLWEVQQLAEWHKLGRVETSCFQQVYECCYLKELFDD
jgi:hypothetical protein